MKSQRLKTITPKLTTTTVLRILVFLIPAMLILLSACKQSPEAVEAAGNQRVIQNKGSDTLLNLALAWAEAYQKVDSSTSITITGGGTGTGIAALINHTADIANASRPMTDEEIAAAHANGIDPVEIPIAIDALAIVVHPTNPVSELTLNQLSDMFTGRITNWNQVGGIDAPIVLVSRDSNSGTHVYFLDTVVRKGERGNTDIFAPQTLLMPSSVGITSEISRNPNAIGYDGLGYVTENEKVVAVAHDSSAPFVLPSAATAADGSYPLARDLFMYTAGEPTGAISRYLDWARGSEGQTIVSQMGFVPLDVTAEAP
jgi:phosphate transport system substrate-binding protein